MATPLPSATTATAGTATEGDVKSFLTQLRAFLAAALGTDADNKAAILAALGAALNGTLPKTGAYTVVAADRGKVISCTGTFTLAVTAAATLGDGFVFAVWNTGSGTITIDPNLSETIDGATTKTVGAGKFALIYCDGTKFSTIGSIATGPGSGLDADTLDGLHAASFAGVNRNFDWDLVWSGGLAQWANLNLRDNWGYGLYLAISASQAAGMPIGIVNAPYVNTYTSLFSPGAATIGVTQPMYSWVDTVYVYKLKKLA